MIVVSIERLYVLINVEPGKIESVLGDVDRIDNVMEASAVTGSYDIIVKIEGESIARILKTVVRDILKLEGINHTETLVAINL